MHKEQFQGKHNNWKELAGHLQTIGLGDKGQKLIEVYGHNTSMLPAEANDTVTNMFLFCPVYRSVQCSRRKKHIK